MVCVAKYTTMKFVVDVTFLKTNEEFSTTFNTLREARNYADWAENNGFRVDELALELMQ